MTASTEPPAIITATTVLSLGLVVLILVAGYLISLSHLPRTASTKTRLVYIWHIFDVLIHLILEGSFVYYSVFASSPVPPTVTPTLWGSSTTSYGARHSDAPLAKLWQEYARADIRWGEADIGVLSLEILTVFGEGSLAAFICVLLARGEERKAWWWICVLATAELYGGWMTFMPEWLSGSLNLVTDVWMYKWVYLAFFNGLCVVIPVWLMWEGYGVLTGGEKRKVL